MSIPVHDVCSVPPGSWLHQRQRARHLGKPRPHQPEDRSHAQADRSGRHDHRFAPTAAYSYDNDPSVRITRGLSKAAETNADLLAIADNAQHVADAVANNALGPMAAWASSDYTQFGSNAMMYTAQTIGAVTHPAKAVPGLAGDPPSTLTSSTLGAGPYGVAGNLANGIAAGAADQTTNASEPTQRLTTQGHDAMDVEFEISAVKPLYNPYVVTMTKFRTPMSKPGEIKTLVYAKSLDPIYTKATRVHFTEEGFPFEYEMVDFQLHIYDRGQEIATNLSSKRVELTRDEAFEYVKIEYVAAHRGETLPAVPAMGKLPAELPTRLAAGKYSEKFFARVSKDGLADEAYADEKCSKITEARQILETQPRAFYSVAEMAFLQYHLQQHPEELAPIRAAVAAGSFHVVGGGMTSPDTLLPESELLFRDFLYGIQFAEDTLGAPTRRRRGSPTPSATPAPRPTCWRAAGFKSVAFSRIDGAPTIFEELLRQRPTKPGSTPRSSSSSAAPTSCGPAPAAARCSRTSWRPRGSTAPATTSTTPRGSRSPGGTPAPSWGTARRSPTARLTATSPSCARTRRRPTCSSRSAATSRTPSRSSSTTSTATTSAATRRRASGRSPRRSTPTPTSSPRGSDVLPTLAVDLTPYFMGFYGSRAEVKRSTRDAARPFFTAEIFATALGAAGQAITLAAAPQLSLLTRADHHDFVTGTATDAVVAERAAPAPRRRPDRGRGRAGAGRRRSRAAHPAPAARGVDGGARPRAQRGGGHAERRRRAHHPDPGGERAAASCARERPARSARGRRHAAPDGHHGDAPPRARRDAPFAWRAVDLLPGAAPVTPSVTLSLEDSTGAPATGANIARVVLSNASVKATLEQGPLGFALTSLLLGGTETIAAQLRDGQRLHQPGRPLAPRQRDEGLLVHPHHRSRPRTRPWRCSTRPGSWRASSSTRPRPIARSRSPPGPPASPSPSRPARRPGRRARCRSTSRSRPRLP